MEYERQRQHAGACFVPIEPQAGLGTGGNGCAPCGCTERELRAAVRAAEAAPEKRVVAGESHRRGLDVERDCECADRVPVFGATRLQPHRQWRHAQPGKAQLESGVQRQSVSAHPDPVLQPAGVFAACRRNFRQRLTRCADRAGALRAGFLRSEERRVGKERGVQTCALPIYTPTQYFNPQAFLPPAAGTFGNVSRDALTGPGLFGLDFSASRSAHLTERLGLQFRAEFFNILNHTNFSTPNEVVYTSATSGISPTAGLVTATSTTSRQIQFGAKLQF